SYWSATRRPLPCLAFVAPLLLCYELGGLWLGGASAETLRTGADAWMRRGLTSLGLTDRWLLPLALVTALLAWQAVDRRTWRFSPGMLAGMAVESVLLAVALIGLSRLVDLGFHHLEHRSAQPLAVGGAGPVSPAAALIGFL